MLESSLSFGISCSPQRWNPSGRRSVVRRGSRRLRPAPPVGRRARRARCQEQHAHRPRFGHDAGHQPGVGRVVVGKVLQDDGSVVVDVDVRPAVVRLAVRAELQADVAVVRRVPLAEITVGRGDGADLIEVRGIVEVAARPLRTPHRPDARAGVNAADRRGDDEACLRRGDADAGLPGDAAEGGPVEIKGCAREIGVLHLPRGQRKPRPGVGSGRRGDIRRVPENDVGVGGACGQRDGGSGDAVAEETLADGRGGGMNWTYGRIGNPLKP